MIERELLRLHIEGGWGISLPPLENTSVELSASAALPPWLVYQARLPQEWITLWHPDAQPEQRANLLQQVQDTGPAFAGAHRMRHEIVLQQLATPHTHHAQSRYILCLLTEDDTARLEAFEAGSAPYYLDPHRAPCIGVIVDEQLVSVAHSSRRTQEACELGIDTIPEARRRGYATSATLTWTQAIRQEGLLPIYSALASNTASLRLAAAAGYVPVIEGVYGPDIGVES